MAGYSYKYVRDRLPEFVTELQGDDYEGDANYDGDQWFAAADYIDILLYELQNQYRITGKIFDDRLKDYFIKSMQEKHLYYSPVKFVNADMEALGE